MQKTVLSLSVAAALAAPTLASAQAVPTLDKVLEASGVSMSGYVDTAYTHANRDIETGFSPRVFDSQNNSFVFHQMGLQIAKQPKQGFGGLVNITAGRDAQVIHSFPADGGTFDMTQAYAQWAGGPLTIIAGKYTTLHGTEVIWSPSNANYSRSILFGSVPFTHTGVRATYAASDTINVIAGLNNGWDQMQDRNRNKTLELGVTAAPTKTVNLAASYYGGTEPGTVNDPTTGLPFSGRKDSFNFVGSLAVSDAISLGLEYLQVKQKDAVANTTGGTKDGTYNGFAGYASWTFMPKLKATLRLEKFDDKDGFRFPGAVTAANTNPGVAVTGTKLTEATLTVAYMAADNFELRGEVRGDKSDQQVFRDGTSMSKSLSTFAVQALYKF